MYYNYDLCMQCLYDLINQLKCSNNESDKRILEALKKNADSLESVAKLNQDEVQVFFNLLFTAVSGSLVSHNNQK